MDVESTRPQIGSIRTGLVNYRVTPGKILPDSRGSGHGSRRVMPSVYPTPEWLRWLKALRGQAMGWEGCGEHSGRTSEPASMMPPLVSQTSRTLHLLPSSARLTHWVGSCPQLGPSSPPLQPSY